MKIDVSTDKIVIYLKKVRVNVDFKDEYRLESFLKKLFICLNDYYNIEIKGYYDVCVYIDNIYGMVLVLKSEDCDFYDYFDKQVDMRIKINKNKFLYKVDDLYCIDLNKYKIYKYLNDIYLLPKCKLNNIELGKLIEISDIIYDSNEIIKKGIII